MRTILLAGLSFLPAIAADANRACPLATTAELEGLLGAKIVHMTAGGTGHVQTCTGSTAGATIMPRIPRSEGASGDAVAKGIDTAKKMGAQVEVKTYGPITCSAIIPPRSLEQHGFNTTCSVVKGEQVAAIEITAKTRSNIVPIEKLHPLAEKMAGRF